MRTQAPPTQTTEGDFLRTERQVRNQQIWLEELDKPDAVIICLGLVLLDMIWVRMYALKFMAMRRLVSLWFSLVALWLSLVCLVFFPLLGLFFCIQRLVAVLF